MSYLDNITRGWRGGFSRHQNIRWGWNRSVQIERETYYICDGVIWCLCDSCTSGEEFGESSHALFGDKIDVSSDRDQWSRTYTRDKARWYNMYKRYRGKDVAYRSCPNVTKKRPTRGSFSGGWYCRKEVSIPDYKKPKIARGHHTDHHANPYCMEVWQGEALRFVVDADKTWREQWFIVWRDLQSEKWDLASVLSEKQEREFEKYWEQIQKNRMDFMKEYDLKHDRVTHSEYSGNRDWGKRKRNRRLFCPECVQRMQNEHAELKKLGWTNLIKGAWPGPDYVPPEERERRRRARLSPFWGAFK